MRLFLALLSLVFLSVESHAEWPIEKMDHQIEGTNMILGMNANPFCSGTIISKKSRLILTAQHCVADAFSKKVIEEVDPKTGEVREKKIETSEYLDVWQQRYFNFDVVSSTHYAAKVVARDAVTDIAIIQVIDPEWVPRSVAPLASRDSTLKRGQTIYVVGNPAGILDASVSKGIVSNTQRKLQIGTDKTPYFQVDAAIIGGNSGGAVYNEAGELIGVVSAAMTKSTIGFAVPVSMVRDLLVKAGFSEFK